MTPPRRPTSSRSAAAGELAELRARLGDAEETLRAIRAGEVDSVVVEGQEGPQVFTLQGAGREYQTLIESMNEGALTLTADQMILYANQCFARMVKLPLERVTGGSFRRFLSLEDRAQLRPLMRRADKSGSKIQVSLKAGDGSQMPVQISIRPLAGKVFHGATIGMVVTDLTEARRNEELLRTLTRRVVLAQEAERGRVALELHDNITQLLCAILVRCQTLADGLSARDGPAKREAVELRGMLGRAAGEVERISRHLRPSVLNVLGLVPVLRDAGAEFADRTGVSVDLACARLTARLPAEAELTFYRILQEALSNVEKHARARRVVVKLTKRGGFVQLEVTDDGVGFDPNHRPAGRKKPGGLGLLGMRERAAYGGGTLSVNSAPGHGATIKARMPFAASPSREPKR